MGNGEGGLSEPPETPLDPPLICYRCFCFLRISVNGLSIIRVINIILTDIRNATSKSKAMSHK